MKTQFVPYELAVKLKELGFDEPCFGYYLDEGFLWIEITKSQEHFYVQNCSAPLWQQAFDWIREKGICFTITDYFTNNYESCFEFNIEYEMSNGKWTYYEYDGTSSFKTYKEARLSCLEKLIELITK